jgi:hypothetical protein
MVIAIQRLRTNPNSGQQQPNELGEAQIADLSDNRELLKSE